MKIICEGKDLKEGLNRISSAIPKKAEMPILNCTLLQLDTNGYIWLTGFNLTKAIKTRILVSIEDSTIGAIAIPYELLNAIIAKLSGELTLEYKGSTLTVKSDLGKFTIACPLAEEYPDIPSMGEDGVIFDYQEAKLPLKMANDVCSTDVSKNVLTGVKFTSKALSGTELYYTELVASDSNRLIRCRINEDLVEGDPVIVSQTLIESVLKAFSKEPELEFAYKDTLISFSSEDTTVIGFTVIGEYPPIDSLFPSAFDNTTNINTKGMLKALDLASPIQETDPLYNKILLSWKEGSLLLSNAVADVGSIETSVDVSDDLPEDTLLCYRLPYLIQAIKYNNQESFSFNFDSNSKPLIISTEDYEHLLMPINLGDK